VNRKQDMIRFTHYDDIDRTDLNVTKEGKAWLKRFESANRVNK